MLKFTSKKKAEEEIVRLFKLADSMFLEDQKLADRYVYLAREISMKNKVKMPRECRRKFCRKCYKYLRTGVNAKIRVKEKCVVIHCRECGFVYRIPINGKKKEN